MLNFFVTVFELPVEQLRVVGDLNQLILFVLVFFSLLVFSLMVLHHLSDSSDFFVESRILFVQHFDQFDLLVHALLRVGVLCDVGWDYLAFIHLFQG